MSQTKRIYDRESCVLLVDDDQTLLKFFKIHLNKFFSKIQVVKNAKEALETLKTHPVDMVISDIRMPKTDGITLLKKIKNVDSSIPVFLISGGLITPEQEEKIARDADGFVKKPFSLEEIYEVLDQGLKKRALYAEIKNYVDDNKKMMAITRGEVNVSRMRFKDQDDKAKVLELIEQLKDCA